MLMSSPFDTNQTPLANFGEASEERMTNPDNAPPLLKKLGFSDSMQVEIVPFV